MKTVVASMGVHTALILPNAQYEIGQGDPWNIVVWVVASSFTVPLFWHIVLNMVIPNSEDWWCKSPGRFSSATTYASVTSTVGAPVIKLWLDEGKFR